MARWRGMVGAHALAWPGEQRWITRPRPAGSGCDALPPGQVGVGGFGVVGWRSAGRRGRGPAASPPHARPDDGPGTPGPDWKGRWGRRPASGPDDEPRPRPAAGHRRGRHRPGHPRPGRRTGPPGWTTRLARPTSRGWLGAPPRVGGNRASACCSARPARRPGAGPGRPARLEAGPGWSVAAGALVGRSVAGGVAGEIAAVVLSTSSSGVGVGAGVVVGRVRVAAGVVVGRRLAGWSGWPGWRATSTRVRAPSQASRRHASGARGPAQPTSPPSAPGWPRRLSRSTITVSWGRTPPVWGSRPASRARRANSVRASAWRWPPLRGRRRRPGRPGAPRRPAGSGRLRVPAAHRGRPCLPRLVTATPPRRWWRRLARASARSGSATISRCPKAWPGWVQAAGPPSAGPVRPRR